MAFKANNGHTAIEFTLIAVFALLLSMTVWMQIANGFTSKTVKARDDFKSRIDSAQKQATADAAAAAAAQAAKAAAAAAPPGTTSGAAGAPISIAGVSSIIQTAGANGATDSLASSMESYAAQLLAAGKITQDQANLLTQLAQAGHDLAGAEAALKSAVDSGSSTVTFGGKTMPVADFQAQFGFDNSLGNVAGSSNMATSAAMAQLKPFMTLYDQVAASGVFNDITTFTVVMSMSQQIASLSDLAKWNTTSSSADLEAAYVTAMTDIGVVDPATTIAGATNASSGVICGAGNGADSGASCTP